MRPPRPPPLLSGPLPPTLPLRLPPLIGHPSPSSALYPRKDSAPPQVKLRPHAPIGQLPLALRDVDSATALDWLAGPPLVRKGGGAVEAASGRWDAAKCSGATGSGPASCPQGSPGPYPHFWKPTRKRPQRLGSCLLQQPLGDKQARLTASFPAIGGRVSNVVG